MNPKSPADLDSLQYSLILSSFSSYAPDYMGFSGGASGKKTKQTNKKNKIKNLPANAGDIRDSIPRLRRSPRGGHGNPLLYSCLENPMDRRAWKVTVHKVTKNWTGLK